MIALARDLDAGTFTRRDLAELQKPGINWREQRSANRARHLERLKAEEARRRRLR